VCVSAQFRFQGRVGPPPPICPSHAAAGRAAAGDGASAWLVFACAAYAPHPLPAPAAAAAAANTTVDATSSAAAAAAAAASAAASPAATIAATADTTACPAAGTDTASAGACAGAGSETASRADASAASAGPVSRPRGGFWRASAAGGGEGAAPLRRAHVPLSAVDFHTHPQVLTRAVPSWVRGM
jgi:hypothetical protein